MENVTCGGAARLRSPAPGNSPSGLPQLHLRCYFSSKARPDETTSIGSRSGVGSSLAPGLCGWSTDCPPSSLYATPELAKYILLETHG
jgi:hypothetical protein